MDIGAEIAARLSASPGMTARELLRALAPIDQSLTKSDINRILYRDVERFARVEDGGAPRWYPLDLGKAPSLSGAREVAPTRAARAVRAAAHGPPLYAWQGRALALWRSQGCRGVVEAVTGTGKTRIGLEVIAAALTDGGNALVLVPSIILMDQWVEALASAIPDASVGRLGGGPHDSLLGCDVLIATAQSASAYEAVVTESTVLVADECHRYGSPTWAAALDPRAGKRLGLTATFERGDEGIEQYLRPYFDSICFAMDYKQAIADEVTAHYLVALIGVRFTPDEATEYQQFDEAARKARGSLIHQFGVAPEPFGRFMAETERLAGGGAGPATRSARQYLGAFSRRRAVLARSTGKLEALEKLAPAVRAARRTMVFTQTIVSAQEASRRLNAEGLRVEAVTSELDHAERRSALARFDEGDIEVLIAPQLLDEGVDVPAADLGFVLAASRSRRQMIQRMGRVLRRKSDDRLARFAVLYVAGTSEDPAEGAHEAFLEELTEMADDEAHFPAGTDWAKITEFLSRTKPNRTPGPPKIAE